MPLATIGPKTFFWNLYLKIGGLTTVYLLSIAGFVWVQGATVALTLTGASMIESGDQAVWRYTPIFVFFLILWTILGYGFLQGYSGFLKQNARHITRRENPDLYNVVENLCIGSGQHMPALFILETDAVNAFSIGMSRRKAALFFTSSAAKFLEQDEIEAIAAQELTQIEIGDTFYLSMLFLLSSAFVQINRSIVIAALFIARESQSLRSAFIRIAGFLTAIYLFCLLGSLPFKVALQTSFGLENVYFCLLSMIASAAIFSSIGPLALQILTAQKKESYADTLAIEKKTRNPEAMARALRKVSGMEHLSGIPADMWHLCFVGERIYGSSGKKEITDRVRAIVKNWPKHYGH